MITSAPLVLSLFMHLRDHIGDQPAPTRLVRRAQPASSLAVEIFMEQDVVLEVRVRLHLLLATEDRTPSLVVAPEDIRQTTLQLIGDLFQAQHSSGSCGVFEPKAVAEEFIEPAQAFYDQIVHPPPDPPAPIGISTEPIPGRFSPDLFDPGSKTASHA